MTQPTFFTGGKTAALSDAVRELRSFNALIVTVAGTVTVLTSDLSVVTFQANAGTTYHISGVRVNVTGTTATGIALLW